MPLNPGALSGQENLSPTSKPEQHFVLCFAMIRALVSVIDTQGLPGLSSDTNVLLMLHMGKRRGEITVLKEHLP